MLSWCNSMAGDFIQNPKEKNVSTNKKWSGNTPLQQPTTATAAESGKKKTCFFVHQETLTIIMISLVGLIPTTPGILPKWLLFISLVSILNSFQTYTNLSLTKKVYSNTNEVTPLSARTFGTWTLISSVIRFYAAYYLANPQIYQITLASYLIAFFHFGSEWLYYKTTKLDSGLYGPLIVATCTITWMISQYDFYVKA